MTGNMKILRLGVYISKFFMTILLLSAQLAQSRSEWPNKRSQIGRLKPSAFDIEELNGKYSPAEAATVCDENPHCAGLTYRGLLRATSVYDERYQTYFVRYVKGVSAAAENPTWVTYVPRKTFARYDGKFDSGSWIKALEKDANKLKASCKHSGCAAVMIDSVNPENNRIYHKLNLAMEELDPSQSVVTWVNLRAKSISNNMNYGVDNNCHTPTHYDLNRGARDNIERVSCDVSPQEFLDRFVMTGTPVIITGCTSEWPAAKWTPESLLTKYGNDRPWDTILSLSRPDVGLTALDLGLPSETAERLQARFEKDGKPPSVRVSKSGRDLLWLMANNVTVRLFEAIGLTPETRRDWVRSDGKGPNLPKQELRDTWSWPEPVPRDLFVPTVPASDYQWVLYSQANTGTDIHTDPDLTAAWNALLMGHKHWVMLPPEAESFYKCHMSTPSRQDDIFPVEWFSHVLPQVRNMSWFGKRAVEAVQQPGEIVYVPHGMPHAVMNLDENFAVTENFLDPSALDLLAVNAVTNADPLDSFEIPATMLVKNLINRDLKGQPRTRRFLKAMMLQAREAHASFGVF